MQMHIIIKSIRQFGHWRHIMTCFPPINKMVEQFVLKRHFNWYGYTQTPVLWCSSDMSCDLIETSAFTKKTYCDNSPFVHKEQCHCKVTVLSFLISEHIK